jgi:hypothetical protein
MAQVEGTLRAGAIADAHNSLRYVFNTNARSVTRIRRFRLLS